PTGGEPLAAGSTFVIKFDADANDRVSSLSIVLSTDGGMTFPVSVASGLPGTSHQFSWSIPPDLESSACRIRVFATDPAGNTGSDTSLAFTVTRSPVISSFTPATGPVGTAVTITGLNFTGTTSVKFNTVVV